MFQRMVISLIILFFMTSSLLAQSDEYNDFDRYFLCDARAKAMGNTEILGISGSNALFGNPANMFENDRTQLSVGGGVYGGTEKSRYYESEYIEFESEYPSVYRLNSISGQFPFVIDDPYCVITVGLAYHVEKQIIQNYEYSALFEDSFDNLTEVDYESQHTGGMRYISTGGAVNLANGLGFGFAYHQSISSYFENDRTKISKEYRDGVLQHTYVNGHDVEMDFESSYYSAGATYKNQLWKVGILVKTAHKIYHKNIIHHYSLNIEVDEFTYLEPAQYGVSVGYNFGNNLILIYEVQSRLYSRIELDGKRIDAENELSHRFGAEYKSGNHLFLRCGVFSDYRPKTLYVYNPQYEETICWTAGLGLKFDPVQIDISYENQKYTNDRIGIYYSAKDDYRYRYLDVSILIIL